MAAKSTAIKGRGGKFGGCAVKAVSLTSGGLRRVRKPRTERVRKDRHRGAEVSRGHSSRCADEGPNVANDPTGGIVRAIRASATGFSDGHIDCL